MSVFRILEGRARPGAVDQIADLFVQQATEVQRHEGISFVQVLRSDDQVLGVSCWQSADAMERYLELDSTREFYRRVPELLMGTPSIRTYEVVRSLAGDGGGDAAAAAWQEH